MTRSTILLAALCALAAPVAALAQSFSGGGLAGVEAETAPRAEGWRVNATRDTAFVYDDSRGGALGVTCYEDSRVSYVLSFGIPNDYDFTNTSGADSTGGLARLLRGVTIMRLTARDRAGAVLGSVDLVRHGSGSTESWSVTLTADQLAALRAASRLELQTNRWAAAFSGSGSARAIARIVCLQS